MVHHLQIVVEINTVKKEVMVDLEVVEVVIKFLHLINLQMAVQMVHLVVVLAKELLQENLLIRMALYMQVVEVVEPVKLVIT